MEFKIKKELAWKDEIPQQFSSAEMTEIKNAISQETANVKIKVEPMQIYSPVEHQVGWWREEVDGTLKQKPVYEKVCVETTNSTTGWQTFNLGLTTIEKIVSVNGNLYQSDGWVKSLGHSTATDTLMFDIKPIDGRWEVYVASSTGQNSPVVFIARYTKTTDEWEVVTEG